MSDPTMQVKPVSSCMVYRGHGHQRRRQSACNVIRLPPWVCSSTHVHRRPQSHRHTSPRTALRGVGH